MSRFREVRVGDKNSGVISIWIDVVEISQEGNGNFSKETEVESGSVKEDQSSAIKCS